MLNGGSTRRMPRERVRMRDERAGAKPRQAVRLRERAADDEVSAPVEQRIRSACGR